MFKKRLFVLSFLLIVSLFLRLIWIAQIPYGLNWDENADAYNAYSIMRTGKDELGQQFSMYFRSFGDYKSALLAYLLIPLYSIFGISDVTVRFAPALLGASGIICFYAFLKRITQNMYLSFIASLVMTTSPWHLHFSRMAADPIIGFSLLMIGLYLLSYSTLKTSILAGIMLVLSMYNYHSSRFFVPVIILVYALVFYKKILKKVFVRHWVIIFIYIILGSVIIYQTLFSIAGSRMRFVLLSNEPYIAVDTNKHYDSCERAKLPFCRIIANRRIILGREIIKNYLLHFQPDFLFFDRNFSTTSFPEYGNLLIITLPFLVIGFLTINRFNKKINIFFFMWLLLAPIPAAITHEVPHPGRFLIGLPALAYFISLGFLSVIESVQKLQNKKILISFIVGGLIINFLFYIKDYALIYKQDSEYYFQGYFREVIPYVWSKRINYKQIYFSKKYADPYIFFAWINKIDPKSIQNTTNKNSIGNIHFVSDDKILELAKNKNNSNLIVSDIKLNNRFPLKEFNSLGIYSSSHVWFYAYEE